MTGPDFTAAIIGSGFGGQAAARMLTEQGIEDFVILERRSFPGGTWCQNTYPGAAVDVPSPLYSLSREPYPWTEMLAGQAELEEYTNHILDTWKLREKIRLNTTVERAEWHDEAWHLTTNDGEISAQFLINASGPLSQPSVPPFPGKDSFAGVAFHTNDWDHSVDLTGKRVAVVGSGASGAQVIPAIVDQVAELHVFQRTPHWVKARPDRKFTALERRLLKTRLGYAAVRAAIYWSLETRVIGFKYSSALLRTFGTQPAKRHLKKQIEDPELRKKLTPHFTLGCKRVVVSNDYYPAIANAKTTLHDRNDQISKVTPSGFVTTGGNDLDLDVIIWATGYDATEDPIRFPIVGRDGVKLQEAWAEYPHAFVGTAAPGFPNAFFMIGPNTGIGHTSAIFVIEAQLEYAKRAIAKVRSGHVGSIEIKPDVEAAYTDMIHREMKKTVWENGGCDSWYRHKSGKVIAMYPGFSFTFRRHCTNFKVSDHVFGYQLQGIPPVATPPAHQVAESFTK